MASRVCQGCMKPIRLGDKYHFLDKPKDYPYLTGGGDHTKVLHINCDDPTSYYPTEAPTGGSMASEIPSERATKLVKGDRAKKYGDPTPIAITASELWSDWLGVKVRPLDVQMMMALHKVAREKHAPQEDNTTDICGYINIYERTKEATADG